MYHFDLHFLPFFRREVVPLYDLVEEFCHHFSRLIVACFDVFGTNSIAVWGFCLFLSLLIAFCNSSVVTSGILLSSLISCSKSSLVVLVKSIVEFTKDVGNSFSRCDAFSFVVLYFVMSTFFFADLIPGYFERL